MPKMLVTKSVEAEGLEKQIALAVSGAKSRGLPVQSIAYSVGISDTTLYNIVAGKVPKIDLELLRSLEQVLQVKFEGVDL